MSALFRSMTLFRKRNQLLTTKKILLKQKLIEEQRNEDIKGIEAHAQMNTSFNKKVFRFLYGFAFIEGKENLIKVIYQNRSFVRDK